MERTQLSIKKEILEFIENNTIEDEVKVYSLSNMLLGEQIGELTKVLKGMSKE